MPLLNPAFAQSYCVAEGGMSPDTANSFAPVVVDIV